MKIAFCFFGLTRNFKNKNLPSIKKYIFENLDKNNIEYDIFIHTYKLNKEGTVALNNEEYLLLNPTDSIIEDQNEVDKNLNFEKYKTILCSYSYKSIKNVARAFHSKKMVKKLLVSKKKKYDVVVVLRPDVIYFTDLELINYKVNKNQIKVTNFNPTNSFPLFFWEKEKCLNLDNVKYLNDRFALGDMESMIEYLDIEDFVLKNNYDFNFTTEALLKNYIQYKKINVSVLHYFYFGRIRADGKLLYKNRKREFLIRYFIFKYMTLIILSILSLILFFFNKIIYIYIVLFCIFLRFITFH